MSGFGAKKGGEKKSIGSGASALRKQAALFKELKEAGACPAEVHARIAGGDKWYKVGQVCAEGDAVSEAVQAQKRLILEAAAEIHAVLKPQKTMLEAGIRNGDGDEVVPCPRAEINGTKVGLQLDLPDSGPYFKQSDQFGLSGRVDTKSSASRVRGGSAMGGNDPSKANSGKMGKGGGSEGG